jgi:esterase/lipase superfamily enzyme
MRRDHHSWHSPALNREMELLAAGEAGTPMLVFPTAGGRFCDFESRGMLGVLSEKIERGELHVFCVDSVDNESWFNTNVHPYDRLMRHIAYEQYILNEVLPLIRGTNESAQLMTTGCGFGGYHAFNCAMKYPGVVSACVSMSGCFDVKPFADGYYDNNLYFNNPVDYLPNLTDRWFLDRYAAMRIVLAAGEHDEWLGQNIRMHDILNNRGIEHVFDVWTEDSGGSWPMWQRMAVKFFCS